MTSQDEIGVLVVDDQELVRAGFRVIPYARSFVPGVVLMDIRMPNLDGLAAARVIVAATASRC